MSGGLLGDRDQITARTPMPVQDVTNATSKTTPTPETVSFTDGAAGTTQRIKLTYDGIMSQYGERIGRDGDSSITWTTGTVLTTEVPWKFKNVSGKDNETDRLATLANGEYMVDYENGYILGKNAISTSSTTDTISYKVRLAAVATVSGGGGDASAANQASEIALLTTIDADTGNIATNTADMEVILSRIDVATQQILAATHIDETTFTVGTDRGVLFMGQADDTGTDSVAEGQKGAARISLRRAIYNTLDTLLAGEDQTNTLFATAEKPLAVATYAPDLDTSAAAEASSVTKAAAGNLYSFTGTNSSGSNRYLQFFNSTTVPADATVPVLSYFCASGGTISEVLPKGRYFSTGIAWCWSSTAATKTIGSTDGIVDVRYK